MSDDVSKTPWGRMVIAGIVIVSASLLIVTLVITSYAFYLAVQARGAPDQERIGRFGQLVGSWLTPFLQIVLTFVGGRWIRRKIPAIKPAGGLILGGLVVLLAVLSQILFRWSFQVIDLIWYALLLAAGWLGVRPSSAAAERI